jgi:hypothetical protein
MEKSKFVNFPNIAEIVSEDEGITIACEIINHSQQLAPLQSIFLQMEASTQISLLLLFFNRHYNP